MTIDTWLDSLDFSQNVEKIILDIIDLQTEGAKNIGSKVFVKVMQIHLNTSGKYVSPERKLNQYLQDLASRGIQEGLFDAAYTPGQIADVILRTSRGVLFDWSSREAPYDVQEVSKSDIQIVLNGFKRT